MSEELESILLNCCPECELTSYYSIKDFLVGLQKDLSQLLIWLGSQLYVTRLCILVIKFLS